VRVGEGGERVGEREGERRMERERERERVRECGEREGRGARLI
jgi:hypothetical protein